MNDQADDNQTETKLERAERVRRERKEALQAQADEQRAADLEAVNELEVEHGDTNVVMLDVPFTPGLPTCIAARTPNDAEIKRYRHRLRAHKEGEKPDTVRAAEELADLVRIYPDADAYSKLRAARPGIHVQLGSAAVKLAAAREESEGKA